MSLNTRQQLCYVHLCDLWSVTRTVNATTGVVGDETYTLAYSNVKVRYQFTRNLDDPLDGIGRLKRPTEFTTDFLHMDSAQLCDDAWIAINRTILPDGTRSQQYNVGHKLLGAGNFTESAGNRRANKKSFMMQEIEHLPATIIAYYAS